MENLRNALKPSAEMKDRAKRAMGAAAGWVHGTAARGLCEIPTPHASGKVEPSVVAVTWNLHGQGERVLDDWAQLFRGLGGSASPDVPSISAPQESGPETSSGPALRRTVQRPDAPQSPAAPDIIVFGCQELVALDAKAVSGVAAESPEPLSAVAVQVLTAAEATFGVGGDAMRVMWSGGLMWP